MTASVSVVIPTRNGIHTLGPLFEGLRRQRLEHPAEIIVVDSGSTDGTRDLAREWADQVVDVPPGEFDHGLTRNVGIAASTGELVVLLVQDALPQSSDLLAELTAPLLADSEVAGVFARQIPRPDASPIARHYLGLWVAANDQERVVQLSGRAEYEALSPGQRLAQCAFDNVCSCIRRSAWERHPFESTSIGEDVAWARTVLFDGARLVFNPKAVVVHSHDRSVSYEFTRTRTLHHELFRLFELQTLPTAGLLLRAIGSSLRLHLRLERASPSRLPRAIGLAFAWPCGQYVGARDGAVERDAINARPFS